MNVAQLEQKWQRLSLENVSRGYKSLRVSPECLPDLYIGISKELRRCLILAVPRLHKVNVVNVIRENLTVEHFPDDNFIVLQLTDNSFNDLFNDLILSLHHRIRGIAAVEAYTGEFISALYRWSEFFENRRSDRLSGEQIKGVFGELLFLQSLLSASPAHEVNAVLDMWKGPFHTPHDFVLGQKDVEVKTKEISKGEIRISSEFQLQPDPGRDLELLVISVRTNPADGVSLKELSDAIRGMIREKQGDFSILLKALSAAGLSYHALEEYDTYRFTPVQETVYDCMHRDFPKLTASEIPEAVQNVRYDIQLSLLSNFILSEKEYSYGS
ncbi:PD-(D/E)XK motif protein [Pontibacter sp. Tf4]|uniref:PD-(D/E)XK motif protein n=1 Tax=Pontibacter sp. Tf4 TaxID=2761620 RepID=UPI00162729E1|nr:PD-(D/E)XK motif protein [Pontibacter sp. Tf4]MBB6611781.1 PD-(D/E)XK motif protein [Pontibacter sp. Tf4]